MGLLRHSDRALLEMRKEYKRLKKAFAKSLFAQSSAFDCATDIGSQTFAQVEREPTKPLNIAVCECAFAMIKDEQCFAFADMEVRAPLSIEERVQLRQYLRQKSRLLDHGESGIDTIMRICANTFAGVLTYLPDSIFTDGTGNTQRFSVCLIDLLATPIEVLDRLVITFLLADDDEATLFPNLQTQLKWNIQGASGLLPDDQQGVYLLPSEIKGAPSPRDLALMYFADTPFWELLNTPLPFVIDDTVRFEHTLLCAGTGHGKTQAMQLFILSDLQNALNGACSVIVIDSQGDLIDNILHLEYFDPGHERSLADKLVLIDPNDVEHPCALNMFDVQLDRLDSYSAVERERILNSTIALYEFIFGSLLGSELTGKQGTVFKFIARLLLTIPEATLKTMIDLMEDGEQFTPYMEKLTGTARQFFDTQFFQKNFDGTKNQIAQRLYGVLSNSTFDRMFAHKENKIDLFDAMNSGKVILINTAKDLLQEDGCQIFGRFFIALILQSALQRTVIPKDQRKDTYAYIDEAQDYFDQNIETILYQCRKYKTGLLLAHQTLAQTSQGLCAALMSCTSTKFAGGTNARDTQTFAKEMRCTPDFIAGMTKEDGKHAEFACYVKNRTVQPLKVTVPFGVMESVPRLSDEAYAELIRRNRERYSAPMGKSATTASEEPSQSEPNTSHDTEFVLGEHEEL